MEENIERAFKGVWIPAAIWEDEGLTWMERCLLAEIDSLDQGDGCFASNEYLAGKFGKTEKTMSNDISSLRKRGYIIDRSFDGRIRKISCSIRSDGKPNMKADSTEKVNPVSPEKVNPLYIEKKEERKESDASVASPYKPDKPNTEKGWRDLRRVEAGKEPTRTPRTEKQTAVFDALRWKAYFRDQGHEQHGMQFFLVNSKTREAHVTKLMVDAKKAVPDLDFKGLIDWWFRGEGEWAQYEPEVCFRGKTIEAFLNDGKGKKSNQQKVFSV